MSMAEGALRCCKRLRRRTKEDKMADKGGGVALAVALIGVVGAAVVAIINKPQPPRPPDPCKGCSYLNPDSGKCELPTCAPCEHIDLSQGCACVPLPDCAAGYERDSA